jgi:hypothetical protein
MEQFKKEQIIDGKQFKWLLKNLDGEGKIAWKQVHISEAKAFFTEKTKNILLKGYVRTDLSADEPGGNFSTFVTLAGLDKEGNQVLWSNYGKLVGALFPDSDDDVKKCIQPKDLLDELNKGKVNLNIKLKATYDEKNKYNNVVKDDGESYSTFSYSFMDVKPGAVYEGSSDDVLFKDVDTSTFDWNLL